MMEVLPKNWQDIDGTSACYTLTVPSGEWIPFPIVKVLYKKSMCTQYVLVVTLNSAFLSRLKYYIMLHDSAWCGQVHITSNIQLTASTFSNSHLTA